MAALEVIALDTVTPQLRAPGASDTYTFPRAVAMSVPLPVSSGGTGAATANTALNALLPSQSSQSGKFLTTDGTDTSWATAGGGSSTLTIQNKTAAYTVVAGDLGTIINCTSGTFTVSLTAAATLGSGFNCWIWNTSATSTDAITIDPSGAETIDGVSTLILRRGEGTQIICDGTNWQIGDKKTMRGYAENLRNNDVRPTATGDRSIAMMGSATASGSVAVAIGFLSTASNSGAHSFGYDNDATSTYSCAIGNNSNGSGSQAVTGSGAMALGGSYASGSNSFAAAVANNTSSYGATGANSVAIGYLGKASSARSICISSNTSISSATESVAIGSNITASANYTLAAGYANTASGAYSTAVGSYAVAGTQGKIALNSGAIAAGGDSQSGLFVLRRQTADATPTTLNTGLGNPASDSTNQIILPNSSAYAFSGIVVARKQTISGTDSAAWKIEGLIRREINAASTTLVASTVTVISNVPGWTLALSADTTNGGLAITATGAASAFLRWVATVQTSEVTY